MSYVWELWYMLNYEFVISLLFSLSKCNCVRISKKLQILMLVNYKVINSIKVFIKTPSMLKVVAPFEKRIVIKHAFFNNSSLFMISVNLFYYAKSTYSISCVQQGFNIGHHKKKIERWEPYITFLSNWEKFYFIESLNIIILVTDRSSIRLHTNRY